MFLILLNLCMRFRDLDSVYFRKSELQKIIYQTCSYCNQKGIWYSNNKIHSKYSLNIFRSPMTAHSSDFFFSPSVPSFKKYQVLRDITVDRHSDEFFFRLYFISRKCFCDPATPPKLIRYDLFLSNAISNNFHLMTTLNFIDRDYTNITYSDNNSSGEIIYF